MPIVTTKFSRKRTILIRVMGWTDHTLRTPLELSHAQMEAMFWQPNMIVMFLFAWSVPLAAINATEKGQDPQIPCFELFTFLPFQIENETKHMFHTLFTINSHEYVHWPSYKRIICIAEITSLQISVGLSFGELGAARLGAFGHVYTPHITPFRKGQVK